MNHTAIPVLMFLAAAVSLPAQQPPPVPLFSAETIKSFTPSDNPITDAKAKLGDMIYRTAETGSGKSVRDVGHESALLVTLARRGHARPA
jgi:hypothetical protein